MSQNEAQQVIKYINSILSSCKHCITVLAINYQSIVAGTWWMFSKQEYITGFINISILELNNRFLHNNYCKTPAYKWNIVFNECTWSRERETMICRSEFRWLRGLNCHLLEDVELNQENGFICKEQGYPCRKILMLTEYRFSFVQVSQCIL